MKLKVLASGSKANCYILEAGGEKLILECGVGFKDILHALDFNISNVAGCLITHEHGDHSRAVNDVVYRGIMCYTSEGTARSCMNGVYDPQWHKVTAGEQFNVGGFTVLPFEAQHDAAEPLGFLIQKGGEKLLFATDTYYLQYNFIGVNYMLIECNYIQEILDRNTESGAIHPAQRKRIMESHFELNRVIEFLKASDLSKCKKIVLLHLSDVNSDERFMVKEAQHATGVETVAASSGTEIDLELYPF